MGKIAGWKQSRFSGGKQIHWHNESPTRRGSLAKAIIVQKEPNGRWSVNHSPSGLMTTWSTKQKALDTARAYMRSHPNG